MGVFGFTSMHETLINQTPSSPTPPRLHRLFGI
jgi:hypothetical protein